MSTSTGSAWWQLLRAGNVLTAISNILAGYLLARGAWQPVVPLLFLVVSSALLYLSGMVLNDVFDLEVDRMERPERPLPSGSIDPSLAKLVGWGLLVDGLSAAAVAAWLLASWLPIITAALLAAAIIAYNAGLKNTQLGPLAMGLCRSSNILLGASATSLLLLPTSAYLYAAAISLYTIGLTLLARNEARESQKHDLRIANVVIQLGCLLILFFASTTLAVPKFGWLCAWAMGMILVRSQPWEAIKDPTPQRVQKSVSNLILLFIPLDAIAGTAAAGWLAGLIILSLLIPTYIATRRIPMT